MENEFSIDYLLGRDPEVNGGLIGKRSLKGYFLRSLRLFVKSLRQVGFSSSRQVDILMYAGTLNQLNTLLPVSKSIPKSRHALFVRKGLLQASGDGSTPYRIHPGDYLIAVFFTLTHGLGLYVSGSSRQRKLLHLAADRFFQCYFDLLVIRRVVRESGARLVVLANDHNPDCRSFLLASRMMKVKTVYMQHAAVSSAFPPLSMDYAFLDGVNALREYEVSFRNSGAQVVAEKPAIFLNGQKKHFHVSGKRSFETLRLGVSLNRLDDLGSVYDFLDGLRGKGIFVVVRAHPGDPRKEEVMRIVSSLSFVEYSDPRVQDLGQFFSKINVHVAADSSIHLEALLSGLVSYYFHFGGEIVKDYYGFMRSGMIDQFPFNQLQKDELDVRDLVGPISSTQAQAVKNYSETFGTPWQGREGELAAVTIMNLLDRLNNDYYYLSDCSNIYDVFRLSK